MAVKLNQIYLCKQCGNLVEVVHPGVGDFSCCNEKMTLLVPNTVDAKHEKHVPVVKRYGNICHVMVGSEAHPMMVEHHIVWIEIRFNDVVIRQFMKPGDPAEAEFCGVPDDVEVTARAYCNLHGLWSSCKTCEN